MRRHIAQFTSEEYYAQGSSGKGPLSLRGQVVDMNTNPWLVIFSLMLMSFN